MKLHPIKEYLERNYFGVSLTNIHHPECDGVEPEGLNPDSLEIAEIEIPMQGLTDEQLSETYNELYTQYTRDDVNIADFILIARTIESKLKELNT